MNPMGLSYPWADSFDTIALHPVKNQDMKPMVLSAPWADSLEIIFLCTVRKVVRGEPNGP